MKSIRKAYQARICINRPIVRAECFITSVIVDFDFSLLDSGGRISTLVSVFPFTLAISLKISIASFSLPFIRSQRTDSGM